MADRSRLAHSRVRGRERRIASRAVLWLENQRVYNEGFGSRSRAPTCHRVKRSPSTTSATCAASGRGDGAELSAVRTVVGGEPPTSGDIQSGFADCFNAGASYEESPPTRTAVTGCRTLLAGATECLETSVRHVPVVVPGAPDGPVESQCPSAGYPPNGSGKGRPRHPIGKMIDPPSAIALERLAPVGRGVHPPHRPEESSPIRRVRASTPDQGERVLLGVCPSEKRLRRFDPGPGHNVNPGQAALSAFGSTSRPAESSFDGARLRDTVFLGVVQRVEDGRNAVMFGARAVTLWMHAPIAF